MWNRVVGGPRSFGRYPLWVACWRCRTLYMPKGWTEWQFWQIGSYRYSGLGGLDGNVFHETSLSRLRQERQRPIRLERGEPYALQPDVSVDLGGIDGSEVRVAVDDGAFGDWRPDP